MRILLASLRTAVDAGTVVVLAGMGELVTERVGVLNLGQEGLIGIGAVTAVIVAKGVTSPWVALLAGMAAAGLLGFLFASSVVVVRTNQVLTGLAVVLIGVGLSNQLGNNYQGSPVVHRFVPFDIPLLADIPQIGPALFRHDVIVFLSYVALPVVVAFLLFRTRHGMNLRAVGENPAAADAAGINVTAMRLLYTSLGAALTGAGGAFLMLSFTHAWSPNVARGRGWVALAVVIFAAWRPSLLVFGALLFGAMISLGFIAQQQNWGIPSSVLSMLPYVVTLALIVLPAALARFGVKVRSSVAPAALAQPYFREER
ncbi:MAG TPA: ABC transporter permease [Actinomycetota bacterium]|nr:ABC transporter permease [Actinomycetota bacterium]